jgi:hypothetical protein
MRCNKTNIIGFLLFIIMVAAAPARDSNLLKNGDFEAGTISGWEPASGLSTTSFEVTAARKHSGEKALKIVSPSDSVDAPLVQSVPVKPGTFYRFSGYIATDSVSGGSIGANAGIFGSWDCFGNFSGTRDWNPVEFCFKTHKHQKRIDLSVRLGMWSNMARGTAYFDDLLLQQLSGPPEGSFITVDEPQDQSSSGASSSGAGFFAWLIAQLSRPSNSGSNLWYTVLMVCVAIIFAMRLVVWYLERKASREKAGETAARQTAQSAAVTAADAPSPPTPDSGDGA